MNIFKGVIVVKILTDMPASFLFIPKVRPKKKRVKKIVISVLLVCTHTNLNKSYVEC